MPTNQIKIHDFSYTLYRWAYDYHNSVNDLIDKHPGLAMFAVKYNNACLAFELIIKSHIAHKHHSSTPEELNKVMRDYGHSIVRLTRYAIEEIGLYLPDADWEKLQLVDKYYAAHQFRYPPYEPRKSDLNHIELLDAINELRAITAIMLVVAHEQTDGYALS